MDMRYLLPNEIEIYFARRLLPTDLASGSCLAACSIADIVELCERLRKGVPTAQSEALKLAFARLASDDLGKGMILIANLEREDLEDSLFESDGSLWLEAAQCLISPMHSVRRITLRPHVAKWWTEEVYSQMEAIYAASQGET